VQKRFSKSWFIENAIIVVIAAIFLFLYHAFRAWGSRLAFAGMVLIIGSIIAFGLWNLSGLWDDEE